MKALLLTLLGCLCLPSWGWSHETTRSYMTITRDDAVVTAVLRIAFRDVEVAVWIDENLDGRITWDETRRRIGDVSKYVLSTLDFDAGGPCNLSRTDFGVSNDAGVAYLDLTVLGVCPEPSSPLSVTSRLFVEIDPDHRLFLTAQLGTTSTTTLLGSADNSIVFSADSVGVQASFVTYFMEGVRHLLAGADHLVFLLVLVLPAASSRVNARQAVLGVLAAVTSFTVAHALTLTAAAASILRPPTALIEILIAVSVIVTAIDNLRPFLPAPRAAVAAFFGLIHGFGFASALGALQLSGIGFVSALVGFNLGIEVAQVIVVLLLLPALYFLERGRALLQIGSITAVIAGIYWTVQRIGF